MKLLLLCCIGLGMAACSSRALPRTSARPPATRVEPVTETLHGVAITDNYRWLEGDNAESRSDQGKVTPEVASWTDAQNALHACRARRPARPQGDRRSPSGR